MSGKLLVATPNAGGDVFTRGVVLVLHHDAAGAHGVVLNKPLMTGIEHLLPGWQEYLTEPPVLFQGGPVGLDSALGLASAPGDQEVEGVVTLFRSVGVVDLDHDPESVGREVAALRVFAGYSGWGPGQLERELDADAWYVLEPEVSDVFTADPDLLWSTVLSRQAGSLAWVANYPDDPAMN